ncbi:hypothetical protein R6Q57_028498 [Mikania cordata]
MLTLLQHGGEHDDKLPQGMYKRGLRTSLTIHHVDGHFDLLTECVNYILVRDKYRQLLSRLRPRHYNKSGTVIGPWITGVSQTNEDGSWNHSWAEIGP